MAHTLIAADLWGSVADFLELPDLASLMSTNKFLLSAVDRESTFERMAHHRYPNETLNVASYQGSWKRLVKDDNAENGVYWRDMNAVSQWRLNSTDMFYVASLRSLLWDRHDHTVTVVVEAFGMSDLRAAGTTAVFRLDGPAQPRTAQRLQPILVRPSITRQWAHRYHDLAQLTFQEHDFAVNHMYKYTYNGSRSVRGSDYECKTFLELQKFASLKEYFDPSCQSCTFVARDQAMSDVKQPSNVITWPVEIPPSIRQLHQQGQWGVVSDPTEEADTAPAAVPPVAVVPAEDVPLFRRHRQWFAPRPVGRRPDWLQNQEEQEE